MKAIKLHSSALFSLLLVALISVFIVYFFNGTGQEADSYHHHLIAKYAFQYPTLFFDHWGKPFYTLLSAPLAQFGFYGSKYFNLLCSLTALFFTYLIAKALQFKSAHLVIWIGFLIPLNFQVNFSAFTEPLFACLLLISIYLMSRSHARSSLLLISFLPMVRSEGLLIIGIFALYSLWNKKYRQLPLLLVGQTIFSLAAWLIYSKSPFWVIREIPYASTSSPYGQGELFHFPEQLFYICGPVFLGLFLLGLIRTLFQGASQDRFFSILIVGSFLSFFIFHAVAWKLGWFNSMGLKRVFGAVTPLMALIMLYGMNLLDEWSQKLQKAKWIKLAVVATAAGLLFSRGPAGIDWSHEMNLSPSQKLADRTGTFILSKQVPFDRLIYADRFLHHSLHNDPYDPLKSKLLNSQALADLKQNDLIIWDNWHAPVDFGITQQAVEQLPRTVKIKEFSAHSKGRQVRYVIYQVN